MIFIIIFFYTRQILKSTVYFIVRFLLSYRTRSRRCWIKLLEDAFPLYTPLNNV